MTATSLGAGNVDINFINGETATLRPSLRAAQTISRQAGGIVGALQAVSRFELDVVTNVVALGLGATTPREIEAIAEKVYATGITDLIGPVTDYLTILANGGRRPQSTGGEGQQDPQ